MSVTQADYDEALKYKEKGNDCYRQGDFEEALKHYSKVFINIGLKAIFNLDNYVDVLADAAKTGDVDAAKAAAANSNSNKKRNMAEEKLIYQSNILRNQVLTNMATVYIKLNKWDLAIEKCKQALDNDNNNSKARLCRAKAYRKMGKYSMALTDLNVLSKQYPNNENIFIEIALCNEKNNKNENMEYNMDHAYWKEKEERENNAKKQTTNDTTNNNNDNNNNNSSNNSFDQIIKYGAPIAVVILAIAIYFVFSYYYYAPAPNDADATTTDAAAAAGTETVNEINSDT